MSTELTFKWCGSFLVVYVNGEPRKAFHREDLVGTRETPPTPCTGELEDPS